MPFNIMDLFQAGNQLGQAQAGPMSYAGENLMNMFAKQMEMERQLQLQAGLFKGEEQYRNQNDPTRLIAAARLSKAGGGQIGTGTGNVNIPSSNASGASIGQNGMTVNSATQLEPESVTNIYGEKFADPGFQAKVEQHKKLLESNNNLNQLAGILDNYTGNLKSAYIQQGGSGGLVRGAAGSALALLKQPNTSYIRGIQNLKMETQAAVARQLQGTSQGIQRMFQVTGHNIPDNWDNPDSAGSMMTDMITNAHIITEGVKRAGLTDEQIMKMSPIEIQHTFNGFKNNMPPEEMQALREHLGTHFAHIPPSQTPGLTGEMNPLETNPVIKQWLGQRSGQINTLKHGKIVDKRQDKDGQIANIYADGFVEEVNKGE